MTCSACQTRQIVAEGKTYRIDGSPAFADFQSLLSNLDLALGKPLRAMRHSRLLHPLCSPHPLPTLRTWLRLGMR